MYMYIHTCIYVYIYTYKLCVNVCIYVCICGCDILICIEAPKTLLICLEYRSLLVVHTAFWCYVGCDIWCCCIGCDIPACIEALSVTQYQRTHSVTHCNTLQHTNGVVVVSVA